MLSILIGPELDKDDNEMEKPEVDNIEEYQASVLEKAKVDEVEEYQASDTSNKQKNDKDDTSITSTNKLHT